MYISNSVQDTFGNVDAKGARDDLRPQRTAMFNHTFSNIQRREDRHWVSGTADGKSPRRGQGAAAAVRGIVTYKVSGIHASLGKGTDNDRTVSRLAHFPSSRRDEEGVCRRWEGKSQVSSV